MNISPKKITDFIEGIIISTFNLYEQLKGSSNAEIENKCYVYKIEDGKAKRVEVTTGATIKPNIEVISKELTPGDLVVSDGIFGLSDGDEITIKN